MCEDHRLLLNNRSTLNCVVTQNRTNDEFDAKQFDQKYRAESNTHKFRGNLETFIQCCWPTTTADRALLCGGLICAAHIKGIKTGPPPYQQRQRGQNIYIFIYYAVLMIWRMLWRSRSSSSSSKHNCEICHAQKMVADIWNVCCV